MFHVKQCRTNEHDLSDAPKYPIRKGGDERRALPLDTLQNSELKEVSWVLFSSLFSSSSSQMARKPGSVHALAVVHVMSTTGDERGSSNNSSRIPNFGFPALPWRISFLNGSRRTRSGLPNATARCCSNHSKTWSGVTLTMKRGGRIPQSFTRSSSRRTVFALRKASSSTRAIGKSICQRDWVKLEKSLHCRQGKEHHCQSQSRRLVCFDSDRAGSGRARTPCKRHRSRT